MKQQEEQLKMQRERAEQERVRLAEERKRFVFDLSEIIPAIDPILEGLQLVYCYIIMAISLEKHLMGKKVDLLFYNVKKCNK